MALLTDNNPAWNGKLALVSAMLVVGIASCLASSTSLGGDRHYKHRGADGVVTFSDAPMVNGRIARQSYTSFRRQPVVANPCRGLSAAQLDAKGDALDSEFNRVASLYSVDAALIKAVARAESCFDPSAVSRAGATGLMQLMPATARAMAVQNILDQRQNLTGGARYLAAMLARYSSNTDLALAAYNAGPGNVDKYNGVPPFRETQRYIVSVRKFRERYAARMSVGNTVASNP